MGLSVAQHQERANHTRYRPGQATGHYESFFQRANHPDRPLAFWIRYTIFSPAKDPGGAIGELWAIYFDGETGEHTAVKSELPIGECDFSPASFRVRVGDSELSEGALAGSASSRGKTIGWDLEFSPGQRPLFMLPLNLYDIGFPKAKSLVGVPLCTYDGAIDVDGKKVDIEGWVGSQNHNWGKQHTDHYAWGQVCGFDQSPDTFLEAATARLKFGPLWTPFMSPVVVRHGGEEYAANALWRTFRRGSFDLFHWRFQTEARGCKIAGRIWARQQDFVALTYKNPPGGDKTCLNTKIASAELNLVLPTGEPVYLTSAHRAAFEILTDQRDHGVPYQV